MYFIIVEFYCRFYALIVAFKLNRKLVGASTGASTVLTTIPSFPMAATTDSESASKKSSDVFSMTDDALASRYKFEKEVRRLAFPQAANKLTITRFKQNGVGNWGLEYAQHVTTATNAFVPAQERLGRLRQAVCRRRKKGCTQSRPSPEDSDDSGEGPCFVRPRSLHQSLVSCEPVANLDYYQ